MSGTYNDHTWANVFHGRYLGSHTAEEAATVMAEAYLDNIPGALDSNLSVTSANFVDLGTELGVSGPIPGVTLPTAGGASGPGQPPNVAYLVHLAAPGTRKQRSGRMYLPGVPRDAVSETGAIDSTFFGGLRDRLDDFYDAANAGAVAVLGILSKTTGGGYECRTVTDIFPDHVAATQRRRLRR